jgi:transposase InsO family protein
MTGEGIMEDDKEFERALFRFSLISPLIHCDDPEERRRLIRLIAGKELDIPYSDKRYITEKTLKNYLRHYEEEGFEGLKRQPRKDRHVPRSISEELEKLICSLKKEQPERSARQIIRLIRSMPGHSDTVMSARTVSRVLHRNGISGRKLKPKKLHQCFEMETINELWEVDISDGIFIAPAGKKSYCFAFIDDYSRLIPHAQFYYDEKLPRLEDCLKKAILKRGIPKAIYADNGKIFVSNHFKRICAELGIRLMHHLPYSPQSKGKIERFFLRTQQDFLIEAQRIHIHSVDELNSYFQAWLDVEYHRQEHHGIGSTPLDRFTSALGNTPVKTIESLEEITEIFLYRENRTVHASSGIIKVAGNKYQATDTSLLGIRIEVRYDPFDLSRLYLYRDDVFIQTADTVDLKNPILSTVPQESHTPEQVIRQSSVEFFTRLKQREEELYRTEEKHIDFTKIQPHKEEE